MTKVQHTPGPWIQNGDWIETKPTQIGKDTIARIDYIGPIGMRNANGRLIAAAPALLEACEKIAEYWKSDRAFEMDEICKKYILPALKKAKG